MMNVFLFPPSSFQCERMMISQSETTGGVRFKTPDVPPWEEKTLFKAAWVEYKNMGLWREGLTSDEAVRCLVEQRERRPGETREN